MTDKEKDKIALLMGQERDMAKTLRIKMARELEEGVATCHLRDLFDELCMCEGNASVYSALLMMERDGYFES